MDFSTRAANVFDGLASSSLSDQGNAPWMVLPCVATAGVRSGCLTGHIDSPPSIKKQKLDDSFNETYRDNHESLTETDDMTEEEKDVAEIMKLIGTDATVDNEAEEDENDLMAEGLSLSSIVQTRIPEFIAGENLRMANLAALSESNQVGGSLHEGECKEITKLDVKLGSKRKVRGILKDVSCPGNGSLKPRTPARVKFLIPAGTGPGESPGSPIRQKGKTFGPIKASIEVSSLSFQNRGFEDKEEKSVILDSLFFKQKPKERPPPSSVPDHVMNPLKYTFYSLDTVGDCGDEENKAAFHSSLLDMKSDPSDNVEKLHPENFTTSKGSGMNPTIPLTFQKQQGKRVNAHSRKRCTRLTFGSDVDLNALSVHVEGQVELVNKCTDVSVGSRVAIVSVAVGMLREPNIEEEEIDSEEGKLEQTKKTVRKYRAKRQDD